MEGLADVLSSFLQDEDGQIAERSQGIFLSGILNQGSHPLERSDSKAWGKVKKGKTAAGVGPARQEGSRTQS